MSIFKQQIVGTVVANEWIEFTGKDGKTVAYREVLFLINGELAAWRTTGPEGEDWKIGQNLDLTASPNGETRVRVAKLKISSARPVQG